MCVQVLQQRKQGLAKLLELDSPEELLRVLRVQPSILHKRTDTLDGEPVHGLSDYSYVELCCGVLWCGHDP
jgi:hypothetical protein